MNRNKIEGKDDKWWKEGKGKGREGRVIRKDGGDENNESDGGRGDGNNGKDD